MERLRERGAVLSYNAPHVPSLPRMRHHDLCMRSVDLTPEFLAEQDCVVLVTDHTAYNYGRIVAHTRLFVDTRNATAGCKVPGSCRIVKA
jgi:UDP-N-acetyl-D-glucosamine dehydrogenase